jgi:hypothetical protein
MVPGLTTIENHQKIPRGNDMPKRLTQQQKDERTIKWVLADIEHWAMDKPRKERLAMAYQLLKATRYDAMSYIEQFVKMLREDDVKEGRIIGTLTLGGTGGLKLKGEK